MSDLIVRIEELSPMRIASVCVISAHPENDAWEKLQKWANPLGLLEDCEKHPIFGFDNPRPSANQKVYGYEFWIKIDQDEVPCDDIIIKDFSGGKYAVTTIQGLPNPSVCMQFHKWLQSSPYKWRNTHELEKALIRGVPESEMLFDLYFPVEKKS